MVLRRVGSGLWSFLIELQSSFAKRSRTYIIPTGFGLAFAVVAIILFFLAAGYANNLVFLLVFLLTSISLTALYWTNRNVDIVKMNAASAENGFVGTGCSFKIELQNTHAKHEALGLSLFYFQKGKKELAVENITVPANSKITLEANCIFPRRGEQAFPVFILEGTFPFGMFKAWRVLKEQKSVLVYPQRRGQLAPPIAYSGEFRDPLAGLFRDHRLFQTADSVSHIDWRASARRQELLVKNFEELQQPTLHFTWEQTEGCGGFEDRLSQMSLWVDEAYRKDTEYSFKLGEKYFKAERGSEHHRQCLTALALAREEELTQ